MARLFNREEQFGFRRSLRKSLTRAEAVLWTQLRGSRLGAKFRRQHGAGPYVLDFYCPAARLALELDGATHDSDAAARRDAHRDAWLAERGIQVVRITNDDVERNLEGVLIAIRGALTAATTLARAR